MRIFRFFRQGGVALVLALSLVAGGGVSAFAASIDTGTVGTVSGTASTSNLLTTYGVRAGSAGPDFLGISNTNVDLSNGTVGVGNKADAAAASDDQRFPLALWGSSVNENPNPYYTNLLYAALSGTTQSYSATTWMGNQETSSWGDSDGTAATSVSGAATISGLEYSPNIIFGANKYVNWNLLSDGSNSGSVIYSGQYIVEAEEEGEEDTVVTTVYAGTGKDSSYNPTYVNNDATNLWTQIYTMGQLASTANSLTDDTSLSTRYNNSDAEASALYSEKAIRGQLLYVASQIDAGNTSKKTVAYLYAIDGDGVAYFFVPTASNLLTGDDSTLVTTSSSAAKTVVADDNYAANNSTINMGYMGVLPFITNTYDSGNAVEGGIVMKVEDIYKSNPACTVSSSDTTAMSKVDVIIFNTTKATSLTGTSGGKNSSNIAATNTVLDEASVLAWAQSHGATKSISVIGGDDWGTSSNQQRASDGYTTVTAPKLYCMRNYTCDKNTRAAWCFSQVYPDLYGNDKNASYIYWLVNVYHVNAASASAVLNYTTNQSTSYSAFAVGNIVSSVEADAETGISWWVNSGSSTTTWSKYAYYNGSSRASFYETDATDSAAAEEPSNTVGIFQPSSLWLKASGVK